MRKQKFWVVKRHGRVDGFYGLAPTKRAACNRLIHTLPYDPALFEKVATQLVDREYWETQKSRGYTIDKVEL